MENTGMYSLRSGDLMRGAVTAVFAGVFVVLASTVLQVGFDAFTADWVAIGKASVNAGLASFVGYLGKNFFTDENGKMFGSL